MVWGKGPGGSMVWGVGAARACTVGEVATSVASSGPPHRGYVQPTTRDVGGDEHAHERAAELGKGREPRVLRHRGVQRDVGNPELQQKL
jgi:hypothetical protein